MRCSQPGVADPCVGEAQDLELGQTLEVFQTGIGDLNTTEVQPLQLSQSLEICHRIVIADKHGSGMSKEIVCEQLSQPRRSLLVSVIAPETTTPPRPSIASTAACAFLACCNFTPIHPIPMQGKSISTSSVRRL